MIPVNQVPGIGPKTAAFLAEQGVTTAEDLVRAGMTVLVQAPGFHEARARSALADAALLLAAKPAETDKESKAKKKERSTRPVAEGKIKKKKKNKGNEKTKPKKKNKKDKKNKKEKKTRKKDKKKKTKK